MSDVKEGFTPPSVDIAQVDTKTELPKQGPPTTPLLLKEKYSKGELIALGMPAALVDHMFASEQHLEDKTNQAEAIAEEATQAAEAEKYKNDIDTLTGVYSRRKMILDGGNMISEASQTDQNLLILFFDIDNFTQVNTDLHHSGGDKILSGVASRVRKQIRPTGALRQPDPGISTYGGVYRFGGEEFVIALPATDAQSSSAIATRILRNVSDQPFTYVNGDNKSFQRNVTISVGGAIYDPHKTLDQSSIDREIQIYEEQHGNEPNYQPLTPDQAKFLLIVQNANTAERAVKKNNIQSKNGFLMYQEGVSPEELKDQLPLRPPSLVTAPLITDSH